MTTFSSGRLGETSAEKFLVSLGYKILTKNFRSKFGEIDIVAIENNTLVFIEVKTRWSNKYGAPEEAVGPYKLKSISRTGEYFKLLYPNTPNLERIDVVAVDLANNQTRLIKDASC